VLSFGAFVKQYANALALFSGYTTNEFSTPTTKTSRTHNPNPEKTVPLFSVHPLGDAKTTGTPTTKRKDNAINANNVSWKIRVIKQI
jgi:hypothetical protein